MEEECGGIYLFLFLFYMFTSYPQNVHEKNFRPTNYSREKILDSQTTHEKNFWSHEGMIARWHETHETYDGTRPTEFNPLIEKLCAMTYISSKKRKPGILDNDDV